MKMYELALQYEGVKEGSAKHHKIIDTYNQIKPLPRNYKVTYNDSWCAAFVSAMAYLTRAKNFPFECSVYYMWTAAKQKGLVIKNPVKDCVVIYDWNNNGTFDHVGICINVSGNTIEVIEGNYSDSVKIRKISLSDVQIEGFFKVGYKTPIAQEKPLTGANTSDIDSLAQRVIKGEFGNGEERKKALGNKYNEVQKRVNELLNETIIEELAKRVIDGEFGNGEERKKALGGYYEKVQKKVNKIMKK